MAAVSVPPRVLMLITELQMGGAAKVVREVSAMLANRFEVHEAVFNAAEGVDFPGIAPPHSLDVQGGGGSVRKGANVLRRIARTRRLKRSLGIDVSISHLEGAHIVDSLSRGREKIVLCIHGSMLRDHEDRGWRERVRRHWAAPWIYGRADRIVTVSRDIASQMRSLGIPAAKLMTINNSFDLDAITKRSREPLGADEQQLFGSGPVLITAGRLAAQKNQGPLLEIFAQVREKRPARLLILGDGELRSELVARAEALGLRVFTAWSGEPLTVDHDVYFLGVRSNPFNLIARSDLFLLPSSWEGFPLALCEAMICGTPVVSTDCITGPREILAPETEMPAEPIVSAEPARFGMLMPVLHEKQTLAEAQRVWTETILQLLDDAPARSRLSGAAARRMQDFSREKIAAQWLALVEELAASPR